MDTSPAELPEASAASAGPVNTSMTLRIRGMSCAACQRHVETALTSVPGVRSATVNLLAHTARVEAAQVLPTRDLIAAVEAAGYSASLPGAMAARSAAQENAGEGAAVGAQRRAGKEARNESKSEARKAAKNEEFQEGGYLLGWRALSALAAGVLAMLLSMPLMTAVHNGDPLTAWARRSMDGLSAAWWPKALMHLPAGPLRWVLGAMALLVMLFAAPEVYAAAWRAARHRATNMNTLVALGTLAAFAVSAVSTIRGEGEVYYEAVILILAFLLAGRWLEDRARHRATAALRSFALQSTGSARLLDVDAGASLEQLRSASETLLPADAVAVGDLLRVLPGDRLLLDGLVVDGRSGVDESMLTGEPLPVTRTAGDHVAGGTVNLDGVLVIRATAVGAESTLAQIARLLEDAQSTRAPMQRLADRVSAFFVPAVLLLAAATFAVWAVIGSTGSRHAGLGMALQVAVAVLIIACPCAMGLAVPAAITVSLGRAAQAGLLIKGGEALERLARIDTMALDKTGTLTEGRPEVRSFRLSPDAPFDDLTLLAWAASLERLTTHPLASAMVRFAQGKRVAEQALRLPVQDFAVLPGTGVRGVVEGHQIALGNAGLADSPGLDAFPAMLNPDAELGHATPLYMLVDGKVLAAFHATDILRASAAASVRELRRLDIGTVLLTGDVEPSATLIAAEAGIERIQAELLPAGKLEALRRLQQAGRRIAMVGDGINDAAALAAADVGFAMASGTDLAREAGDVLLLHADLNLLPLAVRLARRTVRVMRQNLGWAAVYNLVGLPVAAGALYPKYHVLLSPVLASAAMALSSVSVLLNSLRLRRL